MMKKHKYSLFVPILLTALSVSYANTNVYKKATTLRARPESRGRLLIPIANSSTGVLNYYRQNGKHVKDIAFKKINSIYIEVTEDSLPFYKKGDFFTIEGDSKKIYSASSFYRLDVDGNVTIANSAYDVQPIKLPNTLHPEYYLISTLSSRITHQMQIDMTMTFSYNSSKSFSTKYLTDLARSTLASGSWYNKGHSTNTDDLDFTLTSNGSSPYNGENILSSHKASSNYYGQTTVTPIIITGYLTSAAKPGSVITPAVKFNTDKWGAFNGQLFQSSNNYQLHITANPFFDNPKVKPAVKPSAYLIDDCISGAQWTSAGGQKSANGDNFFLEYHEILTAGTIGGDMNSDMRLFEYRVMVETPGDPSSCKNYNTEIGQHAASSGSIAVVGSWNGETSWTYSLDSSGKILASAGHYSAVQGFGTHHDFSAFEGSPNNRYYSFTGTNPFSISSSTPTSGSHQYRAYASAPNNAHHNYDNQAVLAYNDKTNELIGELYPESPVYNDFEKIAASLGSDDVYNFLLVTANVNTCIFIDCLGHKYTTTLSFTITNPAGESIVLTDTIKS